MKKSKNSKRKAEESSKKRPDLMTSLLGLNTLREIETNDFRPECECGICHRKLPLRPDELIEVKHHYPRKQVMMADCENYKYPDYYTVEYQFGYKVIGYET